MILAILAFYTLRKCMKFRKFSNFSSFSNFSNFIIGGCGGIWCSFAVSWWPHCVELILSARFARPWLRREGSAGGPRAWWDGQACSRFSTVHSAVWQFLLLDFEIASHCFEYAIVTQSLSETKRRVASSTQFVTTTVTLGHRIWRAFALGLPL